MKREQHRKRLCYITGIAVIGMLLMTALNAIGHSYEMVLSTFIAAVLLSICLLIGWKKKSTEFLEMVFLILFLILFPIYIIKGENNGFAMLWLTIIPIVFMLMIDLKKGLFFSIYIILFTFIVFHSSLYRLLQYDYGEDMRLRFPFMLLICSGISFYVARITILAKSNMYQALAAAEHANRAKTTFLNNMSHDIRTPMNAIIGFTALCAKSVDDPGKTSEYLNKIATSSNHLLSLINDILDMSRIESGKVRIEEYEVYLPDVLHDLRTIIQSDVANKNLELFIDTLDVKDENVFCDKLRLNQILLNLMSNAIKYTNAGGTVSLRVEQKPCRREDYAEFVFRVRDTGIGMSKEFLKVVFQPFERMQTATISGIQGTGLGMSITKNLVELMGGTITVTSEEGKGSEFTVTLQFKKSKTKVVYEKIPELQGVRVLVADDDSDTCFSVSRMLTEIGMRPDWTTSGKEACL
ncbi:ATP-binding response regulator [Blautia sp. MSJ-19]|uniref:ATP-binding response regulator n=1 Tax=Blautia sp. MSJ-19 TaxID=2841517 RepID=UPI00209FD381|nr:ATP-binding protein [Blautia sp. MSJ-19]